MSDLLETVHFTLYTENCTVQQIFLDGVHELTPWNCTLYTVHFKLYGNANILGWYISDLFDTVHFTLYTLNCTVLQHFRMVHEWSSWNCTLYTVNWKLYGTANILGWYMSDLHDTVHFREEENQGNWFTPKARFLLDYSFNWFLIIYQVSLFHILTLTNSQTYPLNNVEYLVVKLCQFPSLYLQCKSAKKNKKGNYNFSCKET